MKFGPRALDKAEGTILAHSLRVGGKRLRKGLQLTAEDIRALAADGHKTVIVAAPDPSDVTEDMAAEAIADRLRTPGLSVTAPFTGRVNLHAETSGLIKIDAAAIARINAIDEAITVATLPDAARVAARQMVATVKIIPYAVSEAALNATLATISADALTLAPFRLQTAHLILTELAGTKPSLAEKAKAVVDQRLAALGMLRKTTDIVAHDAHAIAEALAGASADLTLILGASATSDRNDVCPAGLVAAGGTLTRFGMPVDPGNLLFLGALKGKPVVGLPGCARSPALNGADWVLERLATGQAVTDAEIAAMGVGGLLKEIPVRPQPRQTARATPARPRVEVILLAAGASRRMRGRDKLLEPVGTVPLLRHSVKTLMASNADAVHVVLPPGSEKRAAAIGDAKIQIITADRASEGMAASLKAGISALDERVDAAIVALADMPDITPDHINRLIAAFSPEDGRSIARAMSADGQPGHPVLFGRRFFESLTHLEGDQGAKTILADAKDFLVDVPTPGLGAVTDLDTPEAWETWRTAQSA